MGLDAAMTLLFITALAFRATGREAHEWVGMAFGLLLSVHVFWNWGWFRKLFRGKYTTHRALNTMTSLVLVAAMIVLALCGILNSRHVFAFSHFFDGEYIRQIHTTTAYWSLVLVGIHAGLHWPMIMGRVGTWFAFGTRRERTSLLSRGLVCAVLAFGIWASCERDMASKLFLGFSFDFWPPDRPLALFYACHLAIMGVYGFVAHYLQKIVKQNLS